MLMCEALAELDEILGQDRPVEGKTMFGTMSWKSWTAWGAILFGLGTGLEAAGAIPAGTSSEAGGLLERAAVLLNEIGALLMGLGIRRRV